MKEEIEITSAMIEAGEEVIYSQLVGAELPPFFRPSVFAEKIFRAMWNERLPVPHLRTTPMAETPAEVMARIRYKWLGFDETKDAYEEIRKDEEDLCRAQLRALAEMEPTYAMVEAAIKGIRLLDSDENGQASYATAAEKTLQFGILAAASEGE